MDQNKATNKTYHQAYPKFVEYNILVKSKKETNLGSSSETLPDTVEMLEIRKIKVTRKIFGQDDTLVTDVFAGNSVFWPSECRTSKSYLIELQRWMQILIRPDTSCISKTLAFSPTEGSTVSSPKKAQTEQLITSLTLQTRNPFKAQYLVAPLVA